MVPFKTDGLLVCEKNISVSHIANGATRLQPVVMNVAQATGMAAAMCVELNSQPRNLPVRALQQPLLNDAQAPAAIVILFNLLQIHPYWLIRQLYYLNNSHDYPVSDNSHDTYLIKYSYGNYSMVTLRNSNCFQGVFQRIRQQDYRFKITALATHKGYIYQLVTRNPDINLALKSLYNKENIEIIGRINHAGCWLLLEHVKNIMRKKSE